MKSNAQSDDGVALANMSIKMEQNANRIKELLEIMGLSTDELELFLLANFLADAGEDVNEEGPDVDGLMAALFF